MRNLMLLNVFTSYGCCNKLLQTWWLKTAQIYSLTAPKPRTQIHFTGLNKVLAGLVRVSGSVVSNSLWPGSSVLGILQARMLSWVAIPFSLDLCNSGIEFRLPALPTDSLPTEPTEKPLKLRCWLCWILLEPQDDPCDYGGATQVIHDNLCLEIFNQIFKGPIAT